MSIRIEEVHCLPHPARPGLLPRPPPGPHRVERVAIGDPRRAQASEGGVELGAREREREVLAAARLPLRELEGARGADANDRERTVAPLVAEAEDAGEERDALVAVVHGEDEMIELRHGRSMLA